MANAGSAIVDTDGTIIWTGEAQAILVYLLGSAVSNVGVSVSGLHSAGEAMVLCPQGPSEFTFHIPQGIASITARAISGSETVYWGVTA